MSNNIYDILGKLDGLTPKANPVSTAEPIYESIDPRGDIMSAVTQLEERFAGFKEAKAKKRKEPSVEVPADDLTRSADPDVVKLATKARFAKPQAKNDFEAIVSYVSKQEKELERAEQADVIDRQKIEQTQGMLTKTQANQDALRKVIDNTDQRFRALNAKVASGQVTQQDQKAAQAAQQIEKDADTAKAAVAKDATAPEQPTTAPEAPQNTSVWDNVPDKKAADNTSDLENQPPAGSVNVPQQTQTWASLQNPDPTQARQTQAALPEPENEPTFFPQPQKVNQRESQTNEGFWKDKDIENQENPTAQAPQNPTTPAELVANNKQQVARFDNEPKLGAVKLQYHGGESINMSRATYEKVARGLSKIGDKILKNRVETDIFSNRDQLSKYINDIESAPGVDYYYFYNVKRGQEAKAFNIGLKQSKGGNWYNPRVPLPTAEEIFGKGVKWTPGQPAKTTAESVKESLGKNTMTKPTSIIEAVRSVEYKKLKEAAKPDFLDLDKDGDTEEPMKSAAKTAKDHEPAKPDSDAVAKRKRLQALKDKQEDERAEKGDDDKSSSRFVKGRAYGGAAQKDDEEKDLDESGLQAYLGKKKYGKEGMKALQQAGREGAGKETMAKLRARHDKFDESAKPDYIDLDKDGNKTEPMKKAAKDAKQVDEVAPPGAKAERMVKGIKKSLSKDGHLSGKDKAIAYATTWKARKKGQVEEATEFKDTVKNSKAELKKHKMVKEGRNPESSEYTYETVGRILSDEQPGLDANSEAFVKAVYDELIEMKMTPKAARWLVNYDQDFISDCATSYGHFCASKEKEAMECGSPMNAFVSEEPLIDAQQELDEIARLAGLTRENFNQMVPGDSASPLTYAGCPKCNADPCCCEDEKAMDEGMGCSEDELNEAATRKDFRMVADLLKSIPDMAKRTELAMYHADIFKQQNSRFKKEMFLAAAGVDTTPIKDIEDDILVGEADVGEGNEFSGALAAAKASGAKEFNVDGKKYTVKEDINVNVSANGEEDVVNLIRKLSGMEAIKTVTDKISAMSDEACGACGSAPCGCESLAEEGPKERDIEYTNTPREEVAGTDAAIPSGTDLHRAKKAYSDKPFRGDNPMAVAEAKEESLWNAYETLINDVKA
jgi:hypothetical protein